MGEQGYHNWKLGQMFSGLKRRMGRFKERDDKGLINAFFEEASHYQKDFIWSCRKILGERRLEVVEEMMERLKEFGSYTTDPHKFEDIGSLFFCEEDDLRFEVLTEWEGAEDIQIKEDGEIISCDEVCCRPVFLLWPKAIRKQAEILKDTKLPLYFTTLVHEYCHFITYCLQQYPIIVASNILFAELRKHGLKGSYLPVFWDDIKKKTGPEVLEMADIFLGLGMINEAQAIVLEELILRELGFDPKGYTNLKKEANPYCKALGNKDREGMLRYHCCPDKFIKISITR